jgi:hypothetical protein
MTDPEFIDRSPSLGLDERDIEAPDADAIEQATPADPVDAALATPPEISRDPEVSDWDALEQARVVELDDEDY